LYRAVVLETFWPKYAAGFGQNVNSNTWVSKLASTLVNPLSKPIKKAVQQRLNLREEIWPGAGSHLWHRSTEDGYSTIPRTLPLLMTLIDQLKDKGKDAARVYLDLWCRQLDDSLVVVSDEASMAYSSGYIVPSRNLRSWRERIDLLRDLGFISVRPRGSRNYGYILLHHPHRVVQRLRAKGLVPENWWLEFSNRASEIGARLPSAASDDAPQIDLP
jgi:hypothetical protein